MTMQLIFFLGILTDHFFAVPRKT